MNASPVPARMAPLDGANLSAMQADLVMQMLAGFQPRNDRDFATATALKAQLDGALKAFDAAHAND